MDTVKIAWNIEVYATGATSIIEANLKKLRRVLKR
jgi:hypothetical protein